MKFAQFVMGPAGCGKSTYCSIIQEHFRVGLRRMCRVVNFDPAAETFAYDCEIDIRDLISVDDVMEELEYGPNGGLVYAMEYIMDNIHWLEEQLEEYNEDDYFLFDCPGQIELYSHLPVMRDFVDMLQRQDFRVAGVYCIDVNFLEDSSKFLSGALAALTAMVNLELPHINVLTKCDLLPPEVQEPGNDSCGNQSPLKPGIPMSDSMESAALHARVSALRKLASQDVVPAVQEVVQLCAAGAEISVRREAEGLARLLSQSETARIRLEVPTDVALNVTEAAVVFGAIATTLPVALWRNRPVVELGCGAGYAGLVLAALGARVMLTDRAELAGLVTASIALNASTIKSQAAAAAFCALDWREPRSSAPGRIALSSATLVIAVDPVQDNESESDFILMLRALFGLDGQQALCNKLEGVLVVHKHQQKYCIGGYTAPSADSRPSITHAEECDRCSFRRSLEDAGLVVNKFDAPALGEFSHPFIECWDLNVRR